MTTITQKLNLLFTDVALAEAREFPPADWRLHEITRSWDDAFVAAALAETGTFTLPATVAAPAATAKRARRPHRAQRKHQKRHGCRVRL
ncbi:MAG: hypothetical protein AB1413_08340 [Thermodesulfobacteriota bacterium]